MNSRVSRTFEPWPNEYRPDCDLPRRHRDTELEELNQLTEEIIRCAIEVHRQLGPGLLEATYEAALCVELEDAGLRYKRQLVYPVIYKGEQLENIAWI